MHDETVNDVAALKMSNKPKALLDIILNLIAVVLSIAMIFMEAIRNDGVKTTIYCVCCGWLAGYFCSRAVKSFKRYRELKGK